MPAPTEPTAPRLLILHQTGGAWSALIAQPVEHGLAIDACERVQDSDLPQWMAGHDVASVRVVLPGASTVCRSIPLGDDSDEALLEQRLHADVHGRPMASEPPHRLAAAVLPPVEGVGGRTGVLLSWPSTDSTTLLECGQPVLAVPDVVGLLALVGAGEAAAWLDMDAGSLSLVLQGPSRLSARCMRETDPEAAVSAALTETAALAGAGATALTGVGPLRLGDAALKRLRARCTGDLPDDLSRFGLAIGCALACTGPLASLTVLQQRAPRLQLSRRERAIASMRTRRTAVALVVAAVALLFIGPIAVNAARLGMLSGAHPELAEAVAAAKDTKTRSQYYQVLGKETWPMTKLLSDIGAAAPLGVVLEQIRIDNGEPVRIRGHATPKGGASAADLITRMKADLQGSRVFNEVTVEWDGKKRIGQREFTMVAAVRNAQLRPRYDADHDYAAWTHQQRVYNLPATADGGPPARPSEIGGWAPIAPGSAPMPPVQVTPPPPADEEEETSTEVTTGPSTDESTDTSPAGGAQAPEALGRRPGERDDPPDTIDPTDINREVTVGGSGYRPEVDRPSGSAASSGSVSVGSTEFQSGDLDSGALGAMPQILTKEQIATLSVDELRVKVGEVAQARRRAKDPEQKQALREYFDLLFERLRELQGGSRR